nr:hypothetical protein [Tanacetum cinerariifolium]
MRRVGKGFSGRITPLFSTMVIQSKLGKGSAMPTDPHYTPTILQSSSSQPQKTHKPRKPTKKVTRVPQPSDPIEHVADEAVHKELGDSLVRAATTASSLKAEQDSGNINKTQFKVTPNESSSQGTDSDGGPRCQEAIGDTTAQTRFESVSKLSNDSLLANGNTLQSDEDRMKLNELMELCTNLQTKVFELEKTKTYQESSEDEEILGENASKQERIEAIDADEDITLVNYQCDADMFDVNDLGGEEEQEEPCKSTTTTTISKQISQDKGKGIMIEEPVKTKKKDQIKLDEEAAKRLQAEFDEEERLARERELKKKMKLIFL